MLCKSFQMYQRRVGSSLKRTPCKRHLDPSRKQVAYQLPRTQGSLSSLKRVPRPLHTQNSTFTDRQHHSGVIHKQGRRHEVGPTLCSKMENLDLVHQKSSNSQSPTHSRPAEYGSRQALQARPDHPNGVVSPSGGIPSNMQLVALASNRPICHEVQCSGCTKSAMGGSGCIYLPTSNHLGQSDGEVVGFPMQKNNSDCSGVAQHALVLGPSDHVQSDPTEPALLAQPANTALQSDPSQKSDNLNLHINQGAGLL